MSNAITIRHNFEAGHRLPHLEGKCQSLHGHSFWAEVTLEAQSRLHQGIAVEYGEAKAFLRSWIDANWDHGLILGDDDPLVPILAEHGKVATLPDFRWPTVENLAQSLGERVDTWCSEHNRERMVSTNSNTRNLPPIRCTRVRIQETHVNAAEWTASPPTWGQS